LADPSRCDHLEDRITVGSNAEQRHVTDALRSNAFESTPATGGGMLAATDRPTRWTCNLDVGIHRSVFLLGSPTVLTGWLVAPEFAARAARAHGG